MKLELTWDIPRGRKKNVFNWKKPPVLKRKNDLPALDPMAYGQAMQSWQEKNLGAEMREGECSLWWEMNQIFFTSFTLWKRNCKKISTPICPKKERKIISTPRSTWCGLGVLEFLFANFYFSGSFTWICLFSTLGIVQQTGSLVWSCAFEDFSIFRRNQNFYFILYPACDLNMGPI